jgi:hypothetical protein
MIITALHVINIHVHLQYLLTAPGTAKEGLLIELRKLVESRSEVWSRTYVLCAAFALFLALRDARDGIVGMTLFLAYAIFVAVNCAKHSLRLKPLNNWPS